MILILVLLLGPLLPLVMGRKMWLKNSCEYTIHPGMFSPPETPRVNHPYGWELVPGDTTELTVDDNWKSARIWARTGCVIQDGVFSCLTGNCGKGAGGAGVGGDVDCGTTAIPPATLAEFTLTSNGDDNYDVSLVDGFNIPMNIYPSKPECPKPACAANINAVCPALLRTGIDATGVNLACLHPCNAGFGIEAWGSRTCCTFGYNDPHICAICGVDYYNVFKDACPNAYAYAYDEKAGALHTCSSSVSSMSDYTVEFCPASTSFIGPQTPSEQYVANLAEPSCIGRATSYWDPAFVPLVVPPSPTAPVPQGNLRVVATDCPRGPGVATASGAGTSVAPPAPPGTTTSKAAPAPPPPPVPGTSTNPPAPPLTSVLSLSAGSIVVPSVPASAPAPPPPSTQHGFKTWYGKGGKSWVWTKRAPWPESTSSASGQGDWELVQGNTTSSSAESWNSTSIPERHKKRVSAMLVRSN